MPGHRVAARDHHPYPDVLRLQHAAVENEPATLYLSGLLRSEMSSAGGTVLSH